MARAEIEDIKRWERSDFKPELWFIRRECDCHEHSGTEMTPIFEALHCMKCDRDMDVVAVAPKEVLAVWEESIRTFPGGSRECSARSTS